MDKIFPVTLSKSLGFPFARGKEALESLDNKDIIVFSHLRWEFVTQRPQHLLKRFAAKGHRIFFVEEPLSFTPQQRGEAHIFQADDRITVVQPYIELEKYAKQVKPILKNLVTTFNITSPILWFYSAFFEEVITDLEHSLVIYDAMDELSAFKGASPQLLSKEKHLFKQADIVFTGGKSLFESKRKQHHEVYCFPSSVDKTHFLKAESATTPIPADLQKIPLPRVGFYGVIDERMDLQLLKKVAQKLPSVSFVMIGPVVKIDANSLPQLKNIYYLGAKNYQELPAYLKGIDVAMMPFALNESTKFISPTKTLEFMAAKKPIVSTAIYDVARDYQQEVKVVRSATHFTNAVEEYLQESASERRKRVARQLKVIEKTSWDNTAAEMKKIIDQKLQVLQQSVESTEFFTSSSTASPLHLGMA
jgi:glycosyltransferase involved in cell wall biosynthesis